MAQVAGMMIVAFSLLTEVSRAHAIGISQTRASAMTTPVRARPNRLARRPCACGPYVGRLVPGAADGLGLRG